MMISPSPPREDEPVTATPSTAASPVLVGSSLADDGVVDVVPSPFAFPRTGKRGVPQQFPRRLYEMLDCETTANDSNSEKSSSDAAIIAWSDSGKAFHILDVTDFAAIVLPKYFRTKKFSSFQRNLNLVRLHMRLCSYVRRMIRWTIMEGLLARAFSHELLFSSWLAFLFFFLQYGFTKVRKGMDSDMYAHPFFVKGQSEGLMQLHKITTKERKSRTASEDTPPPPRSVSPPQSPTHTKTKTTTTRTHPHLARSPRAMVSLLGTTRVSSIRKVSMHDEAFPSGETVTPPTPVSPAVSPPPPPASLLLCNSYHYHQDSSSINNSDTSSTGSAMSSLSGRHCQNNDRGKLDLLAFALEREFSSGFSYS